MSSQLIIRKNDDHFDWRLSDSQAESKHGNREQLTEYLRRSESLWSAVIVIVPSSMVLQSKLKLPTRNRQKINQAVPYALEESLASDIDDQHFAVGQQDPDGVLPVSVVNKADLQQLIDVFSELNVDPDIVVSEFHCLEAQDGNCVVLDKQRLIVKTEDRPSYGLEISSAELIFDKGLSYQLVSESDVFIPNYVDVEMHNEVADIFHWMVDHLDTSSSVNLRQGEFTKLSTRTHTRPWWKFALGLSILLILMKFMLITSGVYVLGSKNDQLLEKQALILKRVFPEMTKIQNLPVQVERKLNELRSNLGLTSGVSYLSLLGGVAQQLEQHKSVVIQSMHYSQATLNLDVTAKAIAQLDDFLQALVTAMPTIEISLESATAEGDQVRGRLSFQGEGK